METWNREELYAEVWKQPLVKAARKYGISAVMLGKVCRKLQIPLPGRGYWIKKEFGKPVEHALLPEAKDLSLVQRFKEAPTVGASTEQQAPPGARADRRSLQVNHRDGIADHYGRSKFQDPQAGCICCEDAHSEPARQPRNLGDKMGPTTLP